MKGALAVGPLALVPVIWPEIESIPANDPGKLYITSTASETFVSPSYEIPI
jgi:hypothetical protein